MVTEPMVVLWLVMVTIYNDWNEMEREYKTRMRMNKRLDGLVTDEC